VDAPATATSSGDVRTEVGLHVDGTWFESSTATVGWAIDRHIWFGKDGTSGRLVQGLSVVGAFVLGSASQRFLQVDGATRISVHGTKQIGTMNNAPVNIASVSGVFPAITTSGNYWSVATVFDGAGYGNVQEYAEKIRTINSTAYAASITPSGSTGGELVQVAALTGNILVNAPTNPVKGKILRFIFTQDGTGGWNVTWNAVFKQAWSDTGNLAGLKSTISFYYDGANWVQVGAQSPYF